MASFSCLKQCEADHISVKYDYISDREGLWACIADCNVMLRTLEIKQPKKPLPKAGGFYTVTGGSIGILFLIFIFFALGKKSVARKFKIPIRPPPFVEIFSRKQFEEVKQEAERKLFIEKLCSASRIGE